MINKTYSEVYEEIEAAHKEIGELIADSKERGNLNPLFFEENFKKWYSKKIDQVRSTEKEIVICSAIKMPGDYIIRGHRHSDCFRKAQEMRYSTLDADEAIEGFVTSKNRFVNREEAFKIQKAAGILSHDPGGYRGLELYSEDLY